MSALRMSVGLLLALSVLLVSPRTSQASTYEEAERQALHELRLLRIQIYDTFRMNRSEYNRRCEIANRTWLAWKNSGADPTQGESLIAWMRGARRASHQQALAALPRTPEFMFVQRPLPQPEVQLASERKPAPASGLATDSKDQNAVRSVGRALKRSVMLGAILPWGG